MDVHVKIKPPLNSIISAHDFAAVASETAAAKTWGFYSSAATDGITCISNKRFLERIWFRPRVFRNVSSIDLRTRLLGVDSHLPFFVSPAGLVKMINQEGEIGLAKACQAKGIVQIVSNNTSIPLKDIVASAPNVSLGFQLYLNRDRDVFAKLLDECSKTPQVKALFLTVDGAYAGKRELDERIPLNDDMNAPMTGINVNGVEEKKDSEGGGTARLLGNYIDPSFNWDDLAWIRRNTHLPLVLKGIMTASDAILAMKAGVDGIVISNHGGRNLDTSPPTILVLLELNKQCPEIFQKIPVYIDGGFTRGTDILKALALGASAVGLGRSVLYAANYGQKGVEHLITILEKELTVAMGNTGLTHLAAITKRVINTRDIDHLIPDLDEDENNGTEAVVTRQARSKL